MIASNLKWIETLVKSIQYATNEIKSYRVHQHLRNVTAYITTTRELKPKDKNLVLIIIKGFVRVNACKLIGVQFNRDIIQLRVVLKEENGLLMDNNPMEVTDDKGRKGTMV
jgi:hypothetical protein